MCPLHFVYFDVMLQIYVGIKSEYYDSNYNSIHYLAEIKYDVHVSSIHTCTCIF